MSPLIYAWELGGSVSLGAEYSDNSRLAEANEENELILAPAVAGTIKEDTGPFSSLITASFQEKYYTQDTFGDRGYFNLKGAADWEFVRNRATLQVRDYFQQYSIDAIGNNTPNNLQDTNVFSIGPVISLPLGDRHRLTIRPTLQDFYYEESVTDNQQLSLGVDWMYALFRSMDIGLGLNITDTDYEDEVANSNYTITNGYVVFSGQRSNFDYTMNLGATNIERDNFADQDGATGGLTLTMQPSGRSELRLRVSSALTDVNRSQFLSLLNIADGDFANEQISSDVLRNKTLRLQYGLQGDRLSARAWTELRDLDYAEDNSNDREVEEYGVGLDYKVSELLTIKAIAKFNDAELTQTARTDEQRILGAGLRYRLYKRLSASADLFFDEKNSSLASIEYDETSILFRLVYDLGAVQY